MGFPTVCLCTHLTTILISYPSEYESLLANPSNSQGLASANSNVPEPFFQAQIYSVLTPPTPLIGGRSSDYSGLSCSQISPITLYTYLLTLFTGLLRIHMQPVGAFSYTITFKKSPTFKLNTLFGISSATASSLRSTMQVFVYTIRGISISNRRMGVCFILGDFVFQVLFYYKRQVLIYS